MPYIKSNDGRREKLQQGYTAESAGELNYQIFYYVKHHIIGHIDANNITEIKFFVDNFLGEKPNYQKYNDMSGVLVRCSREISRRLCKTANELIDLMNSYDEEIDKYEDIKIIENGDVE